MHSDSFNYLKTCSTGQASPEYFPTLFDHIYNDISHSNDYDMKRITHQDILTGFEVFSVIVDCSESVAISKFLHSLLSTQSARTIIQATVNTINYGPRVKSASALRTVPTDNSTYFMA